MKWETPGGMDEYLQSTELCDSNNEHIVRKAEELAKDVEVYNSYMVALYEHMARSCAEWGIPVLNCYQLWDAPDADPDFPELAGTGDGVPVSDEGDVLLAELLRELGYEFVKP